MALNITSKMFSLEGKTAVVTGGGRGLGRAICEGLAEFGAKVAVIDIDEKSCLSAAEEIQKKYNNDSFGIMMDISKVREIESGIAKIFNRFGQIDILVNNAGVVSRSPILDMEESDWDRVMDINVKGMYFCAKEAAKHMVQRKYGKIINIASISSYRGIPNRSVYCVSKGAVLQATRVMAVEWAPYNIHVNAVAPCYLDTPLTSSLYTEDKEFYEYIMRKTPLKRIAKPEELVGGVIYLASDSSDMVTGATLPIDGGWLAE
ncbi:MAG TPA: glucose 1-dehydrogenase [Anaerovoracaceae bacterium]|nr:glucose 1-dehydrogenase [Anaerovoracaceae bacterium]